MSEEDIRKTIEEYPKWEQRIRLPFGIETPGRDRSSITDHIFPSELRGASVLDYGCEEGYFSFEAKRRGAGQVVGIATESGNLNKALRVKEILELDVEFKKPGAADIGRFGMFDYVLSLNRFFEFNDPIHVLTELVNIAEEELVVEIADISLSTVHESSQRNSKVLLGWWRKLFDLLPPALRPGIMAVDSRGRFLLTRKFITNLFKYKYFQIQNIRFSDSDSPDRYLVSIIMRKVDRLKVISGVSGVGKTVLLDKLLGGDQQIARLLDLNSLGSWKIMDANSIKTSGGVEINNLIFHLNITRPSGWVFPENSKEPARIIERSEEKEVYVLVCSPQILLSRVRERNLKNDKNSNSRRAEKGRWMISQYEDPGRIPELYGDWISYCKSENCKMTYIDVSSEIPKEVTEKEAFGIIGS